MGKITILKETTKNPITLIGERAGICYGADVTNVAKNYKRGMDCIQSNHGRALEYVNVEMVIDEYSARVIREYTRHIGGSPTFLQASTRYINYNDFDYIIPKSIETLDKTSEIYEDAMNYIKGACDRLKAHGIPKEDIANLLPLGMTTKIVDKRNLRNLVDMSHVRECNRAYWEYREMFNDIKTALSDYSGEWKWVVENLFMPKCKLFGKCTEKKGCGKND